MNILEKNKKDDKYKYDPVLCEILSISKDDFYTINISCPNALVTAKSGFCKARPTLPM